MKIMITGANGMLGSSISSYYNSKHSVYAFHRDKKRFIKCKNQYCIDLSDFELVQKKIHQIKPDMLIHCAGLTDIELCEKEPSLAFHINANITKNIALACKKNTKLVYISTDQVYGLSNNHSEKISN